MTVIASAAKSHRLLEPLLPCFSCFVEFLFRLICYDSARFDTCDSSRPLATFFVLGSDLRVGDGSGCFYYRQEELRLLDPPCKGGIAVPLLRQNGTQRQCNNHAGTYSMNCDEQKMASVTLMLLLLPLDGHSDTELARL